jgi:hypothetical protein
VCHSFDVIDTILLHFVSEQFHESEWKGEWNPLYKETPPTKDKLIFDNQKLLLLAALSETLVSSGLD